MATMPWFLSNNALARNTEPVPTPQPIDVRSESEKQPRTLIPECYYLDGCVYIEGAFYETSICDNEDILVVGGIMKNGNRATASNSGNEIDVVAPFDSIYVTTYAGWGYEYAPAYNYESGTSFSAAYVSGIAGLLLSEVPHITRQQAVNQIERSTQKIGLADYNIYKTNGTWNSFMGYGLVDAYGTLYTEYTDTTIPDDNLLRGCNIGMHDITSCGYISVRYYSTVSIENNFYLDLGDEIDFICE